MTAIAINESWTALRGKLVFDFTLYPGEAHGESKVRIHFIGDREQRVHEIVLPAGRTRDIKLKFKLTSEGEVYVKGTLRREYDRHLGDGIHIGVFADIVFGHHLRYDEQHFEGFMVFTDANEWQPRPAPEPALEPIPEPPHGLRQPQPFRSCSPGEAP